MVCSGRWGNMFVQENLGLYALSSHVQWRNLGLFALGNHASMDSVGKSWWLRRVGAHLPHDTIFSQRIWACFPIFVALSSHVSPTTLLIYLGQLFSLKLAPILHQNIMFPWVHCKETWSHCNGLKLLQATMLVPRKLGQLFLVGHCHFHSFFFANEGHLGRKIVIKRFEFWISHLTLNWQLINTIILF